MSSSLPHLIHSGAIFFVDVCPPDRYAIGELWSDEHMKYFITCIQLNRSRTLITLVVDARTLEAQVIHFKFDMRVTPRTCISFTLLSTDLSRNCIQLKFFFLYIQWNDYNSIFWHVLCCPFNDISQQCLRISYSLINGNAGRQDGDVISISCHTTSPKRLHKVINI